MGSFNENQDGPIITYLSRSDYLPAESKFLDDKLGIINQGDKLKVDHNPPTGNEIVATRKKYKTELTKLFSLHSAFMILNLIFYKYTFQGNVKCKFALINYTESDELKEAIVSQGKFDGVIELPYKINVNNSKNHKTVWNLIDSSYTTSSVDMDRDIMGVIWNYSFNEETGSKSEVSYDLTFPTYSFKLKKDPDLELNGDNINTVTTRLAVFEIQCFKA